MYMYISLKLFPNKSTYLLLLFSAKVTNYTLIYVISDMVLR